MRQSGMGRTLEAKVVQENLDCVLGLELWALIDGKGHDPILQGVPGEVRQFMSDEDRLVVQDVSSNGRHDTAISGTDIVHAGSVRMVMKRLFEFDFGQGGVVTTIGDFGDPEAGRIRGDLIGQAPNAFSLRLDSLMEAQNDNFAAGAGLCHPG